jgi:hypothetical protein
MKGKTVTLSESNLTYIHEGIYHVYALEDSPSSPANFLKYQILLE